MASIYETIMELPLFKGIGEDQLSLMLEKTVIEFLKYEPGDIIAEAHQRVKALDFILSGKVRNTFKLKNYPIEIDEILVEGGMLGAIRLYGLDTTYTATTTALEKVSLMRLEKSQYMKVLQSDSIYILNFVNYLSASAQKAAKLMIEQKHNSIFSTLYKLAISIASRGAESVSVVGSDEVLAGYCGVELLAFRRWKNEALSTRTIMLDDRGIVIKSDKLTKS